MLNFFVLNWLFIQYKLVKILKIIYFLKVKITTLFKNTGTFKFFIQKQIIKWKDVIFLYYYLTPYYLIIVHSQNIFIILKLKSLQNKILYTMEEAQAHDRKRPSPSPNTSSSFSSNPTNRRYGPTKHHWMSFFCNYFWVFLVEHKGRCRYKYKRCKCKKLSHTFHVT